MALERTPEALAALEDALIDAHGSISAAARIVGCKAAHIHMWMQADPSIYDKLRAAQMIGHARLEDVAISRATEGVEEAVYHKGEIVGWKTNYSDGLLQTLLKARVEGYGDTAHHTSLSVNVAIMPRANSYEEWVVQREQALAPQLPAPQPTELIEEAEYTDVKVPTGRLRDVL
jgi:hypothetical protein